MLPLASNTDPGKPRQGRDLLTVPLAALANIHMLSRLYPDAFSAYRYLEIPLRDVVLRQNPRRTVERGGKLPVALPKSLSAKDSIRLNQSVHQEFTMCRASSPVGFQDLTRIAAAIDRNDRLGVCLARPATEQRSQEAERLLCRCIRQAIAEPQERQVRRPQILQRMVQRPQQVLVRAAEAADVLLRKSGETLG
jgi:hypothetical protein